MVKATKRPPPVAVFDGQVVEQEAFISPLRRVTLQQLRTVSEEQVDLFDLCGITQPALERRLSELTSAISRNEVPNTEVPASGATRRQPLHRLRMMIANVVAELQYQYSRAMASLESSYPMLAGHIELLVGSLDLAVHSVKWFRFGFMAVYLGFRLIIYALVLLPAFLKITYAYFHDKRIIRHVRCGPYPRNYIDIYCPAQAKAAQDGNGAKVPVVIAVMGGAWVMGHRAWNAQLGLRLMDFGVLVFAVDYRNFPFGRVPEMVQDLSRGFGWVFANAEAFGGDINNVVLIGQSAGAHLSALLLLEHSLLEAKDGANNTESAKADPACSACTFHDRWSGKHIKHFIGVSGPYDLVGLEPHLVSRGIYSRILYSLSVDGDLAGCSPSRLLKTKDWEDHAADAVSFLPPMYLFTGGKDKSVPSWSSIEFAESLRLHGHEQVQLDVRPEMTHTYPVIEGPMAGVDPQVNILLPYIWGKQQAEALLKLFPGKRLWPQPLIDIASMIMPY